jgi:hypothetical protein
VARPLREVLTLVTLIQFAGGCSSPPPAPTPARLSPDTIAFLHSITSPVEIRAYYSAEELARLQGMMVAYKQHSTRVDFKLIDAGKEPDVAERDRVGDLPVVVVEAAGRRAVASDTDESHVNEALAEVLTGRTRHVSFIQGHGEHDAGDTSMRGYSRIADAFRAQGIDVGAVTLTADGPVPDAGTVLVVGGPRTDYSAADVAALRRFAEAGVGILLMVDGPDSTSSPSLANLVALARGWSVSLGYNVIIDTTNAGQMVGGSSATAVGVPAKTAHQIMQDFSAVTLFPVARSATPIPNGMGRSTTTLLETSEKTWAEGDLVSLFDSSKAELDVDLGDRVGPVSLMVAVTGAQTPETGRSPLRVVVAGDSDYLTNAMMDVSGNRTLGLKIIKWLSGRQP